MLLKNCLIDASVFALQSTFRLAELLKADGISYSVKSFTVRDGIEQLGDNPFVSFTNFALSLSNSLTYVYTYMYICVYIICTSK